MTDTKEVISGVQELIDKLRNQGMEEGQHQAELIVKEAHHQASQIMSQAQLEADKLLAETRRTLEIERKSSHEAIKTSFRDSELALRSRLRTAFSAHLKRLVSLELEDKDFIKQLVLEIAGLQTADVAQAPQAEVLLPARIFETEEDGTQLSKEGKTKLHHLVLGITNEMLREGVELKPSSEVKGGIKVQLIGNDLQIDLTDEALTNLLLKYLLPRYQEIVSGQGEE